MENGFQLADQLMSEFNSLKPISKEWQEKLDKKFRLEFNYNSNHIEGNTLTYNQTELLLLFDDVKGDHSLREFEEMKAHDVAYLLIEEFARDKERNITEQFIKNLNEIILVRPYWKEAITEDGQNTRRKIEVGTYKIYPNSVRLQNGEIFRYPSPLDTPPKMSELLEWFKTSETTLHPIRLAALFHYKFVIIHPFDDGNGRISRLLMNYVLLKYGYPPVIIKSSEKSEYLRALHSADAGNLQEFVNYISTQVEKSIEISIRASRGEAIEEKDDWEKELEIFKKKLQLDGSLFALTKYSKANVDDIFSKVITRFAIKWEIALRKFDILFYTRTCTFQISSEALSTQPALSFNSLDFIEEFLEKFKPEDEGTTQFAIYVDFQGLRSRQAEGTTADEFYAGTINFEFLANAYKVSFQNLIPSRSLLYGQFMSENEMADIIGEFSKRLMDKITKASSR